MDKRRRAKGKGKAKAKGKSKSKTGGVVTDQTTLPIEFRDKTLYLCGVEFDSSYGTRIKIHAIDLVELLTSSSSSSSPPPPSSTCRVVSFLGPRAGSGGVPGGACGVSGGSKIVFAGERYRNPECPLLDTYAFSVHDPNKEICSLPGKLNVRKVEPSMAVVAGELYIMGVQSRSSFEVFDSNTGTWSALPDYPMTNPRGMGLSFVVAGNKLFVSTHDAYGNKRNNHSMYCFDPKKEKPEWRRVDTIGPFPFEGRAFVVDLPDHPSKKLLFTGRHGSPKLAVYLMSLVENEESLCEIAEMNLSDMNLPFVLHKYYPRGLHFFHLGGNNVCFVASCFWDSEYHEHVDEPKSYLMKGAAVPFQFEFDISKVGMKDCFTVQFQPPRFFEYHTSSDCTSGLAPSSCFLL